MITIAFEIQGGQPVPARALTAEELLSTDGFPVHRDANFFYYFESDQEFTDFIAGLPVDLANYKNDRINAIDARTREIINNGFTFDNHLFSLSANAQLSWNQLLSAVTGGVLVAADFPFKVSDKADVLYDLSWVDRTLFFKGAAEVIANAKISGSLLKQTVLDAIDVAGVDLVVDNR